ncbi:uncharacterized protein LOC131958269 isoform X2 [Physella acuta]|uniref:uncharacterized protein LOC131958269 isoform X2 n=1 Tax=Physella acuta TaxID=109671 RepID=UPI0027DDCBCA|nr:uncharacterized protein LOC131958269 isoform X2 [Physella acuta]
MELTIVASFALISCLYLATLSTPVSGSGKCKGKWQIHACFGGNGKRSDPNMSQDTELPASLLKTVLISDAQKLNRMLSENEALPDEASQPAYPYDDTVSKNDYDYNQQLNRITPEIRNLRKYLEALKIQHALRESGDDLI